MNLIIILLTLLTIVQLIVCHFSLWWIIVLICRCLFAMRIVGATFKVKKLVIGEGVAFASMLVWNMLFAKGHLPWARIGLFLLFTAISAVLMFIDDIFYVYVIEDDDDE